MCCELGTNERRFSPEAITALKGRSWPGNVRELQNVVRQAILFSTDEIISIPDLQSSFSQDSTLPSETPSWQPVSNDSFLGYKEAKEDLLQKFMSQYVVQLLQITRGNVSRAAEMSGLTRAALQKIMQRTDIKAGSFRGLDL